MKLIGNLILAILLCVPQIVGGVCIQGDCINGHGTAVLPDESKYVGQFEDGKRNGQGEATYSDGSKYKGKWADDLPNGQGVKTLADGMQYSGEFKNGLMYGSGTIVMPDGGKIKIKWLRETPVEKEEIESGAQISGKEEQKEWYMNSTLKEVRGQHSQESQESAGHVEVSAQELASSPEPNPPQEPEVAVETAVEVSPRPRENQNSAIKEQAQQMEANNKISMVEAEKMTPEAVMPAKGEEGSGPLKGYALYYETTNGVKYASISKGANIRSDPSLTSEVLRTVPSGYPVAVLEQQEDWFLVQDFRERKGWVYESLLIEPETVIMKVYKGNLRSGPSLKDDVIVQLDHGTVVSVVETRGDWLRVSDSGNLTGWLHRKVIWPF